MIFLKKEMINDYNGNIYLNAPSNSYIILILDEIGYLIDKFHILLYNIYIYIYI